MRLPQANGVDIDMLSCCNVCVVVDVAVSCTVQVGVFRWVWSIEGSCCPLWLITLQSVRGIIGRVMPIKRMPAYGECLKVDSNVAIS